jgi:hypothetical protein
MTDLWVVLLNTGTDFVVYGPFGDAAEAGTFAQWLTQTVDPAIRVQLHSPTAEMLAWWRSEQDRNNCTHGDGCPVHPFLRGGHRADGHTDNQENRT